MAKRRPAARPSRRPQVGAAPGTVVARPGARAVPIRVIRYTETELEEHLVETVEDCRPLLARPGVCWLDLDQAPDAATLESLCRLFDLHRLAIADVANVPQRPKHEPYENFDFIVLRMPMPAADATVRTEQLSLFFGERWVLTVQEEPGDCLEPVRSRLRAGAGGIRRSGADYLAYALVDAVVDGYFPLVESQLDRLEKLEVEMTARPDRRVLHALHEVRRELLHLRRAVWPMRDALLQLTRDGEGRFTSRTRIFLRDCYDHAVQVLDLVETSREMATSLVDLHLSLVGFRTNEVVKVLTIISTIFLPLTFIAGVYGMNFDVTKPGNMPELSWDYGYAFSLGLMAASAVAMLVYFRRKGWLGRDEDLEPVDAPSKR